MEGSLARADISEKVIQLFVDIIGFIDRSEVTEHTDFIHDFDIIDDDVTCFVMQIKWQFKLQATQEDWDHITTLEQIVARAARDPCGNDRSASIFPIGFQLPQRHPPLYGAGQNNRGLAEAELRYPINQALQLGHRAHRRLHDHAGVARDPVAFGEFGYLRQGVVHLLAAMVGQPQLNHALNRQAHFG